MDNQNVVGLSSKQSVRDFINIDNISNASPKGDLYAKGFVGINEDNIELLKDDIKSLIIEPIEKILDGYNEQNVVSSKGIKGKSEEAMIVFISSVKQLIRSYISTYINFMHLADSVLESMIANDATNSQIIDEASEHIRDIANNMNVD